MKRTILLLSFICLTCVACNQPREPKVVYPKWHIKLCNSIGCDHFDCESYTKDGDTYLLYDKSGKLIGELAAGSGIAIITSLNNQ